MPDDDTSKLTRRAALQGLAGTLGLATVAAAGEAHEPHPIAAHLEQRPRPGPARAASKPEFLDSHQFATLGVIANLVVPGAVASASPAFIDHVLAVEGPDVQLRFVGALGAFDAAARARHSLPFIRLTPAQQTALLENGAPEHLAQLKTWIAGAHYSSEAGMKELGWTGTQFYAAFEPCPHPDGHE